MANQKSYRKFLATGATAAMVATAVVPAASFAAESTPFKDVSSNYSTAVNYLYTNGITSGKTETTFGTYDSLTRGDAAVIIAKALKLDTAKAKDAGFKDVNSRVKGAVNALVEKGIISGYTKDEFKPAEALTRGAMAKILANAYGFADYAKTTPFTDVSSTFKPFVEALYGAGITGGKTPTTYGTDAKITRGDFANLLYKSIKFEAPTAKVVGVTAVDGTTLKVSFSQPVDEKTLVDSNDKDVISVVAGDKALDAGTLTQSLSEDGKTLTIKAQKGYFFKGDYTVKVPFEIVKTDKGAFVSAVNQKVSVNDTDAPVLSSATSTIKDTKDGIKAITLTFNEDVTTIDTVKINGQNYSVTPEGNQATVSVDLDATKSYDVTVVNATDAAGNIKDVQAAPLKVTVDNVAPSVTGVVATGENTVKVTVDKPLSNNKLTISGKVGSYVTDIVTKAEVNPDNNKEYFVTLNSNYLFKNGNSDTVTLTVAKEALVDTLGNVNSSEITKSVVLTKDATAPGVSKVETTTADGKVTGFVVTYNEEVTGVDFTKVSVVNSKGEILSPSTVVSSVQLNAKDNKQVVFTLADGAKDKYSFDLAKAFVTDKSLSANESAQYSFTVDSSDTKAPVETSFKIASVVSTKDANDNPVKNSFTVDFGAKVKATGTGSALNPAAYQVNGVVLPADTKIAFVKNGSTVDQTKVVIELPAGYVQANDDKAIFRVTGVQTLDNKTNSSFIATLPVYDNTAPVLKSFAATDLHELTLTYSEAITVNNTVEVTAAALAEISDELALYNTKGASVSISSYSVNDKGQLVLELGNADDAASIAKVTTVKTTTPDIFDANNNSQKDGVTVNK